MALTMRVVLALATLMVATGPAWAAERPPQVLYRQWVKVTVECRGGTDSAAVDAACKRRNVIDRELNAVGWCFGRPDEDGAHMDWHRCGH